MNRAAQSLGRLGGKAGTGAAKARTSEQARAAVQARWKKHRKTKGVPAKPNADIRHEHAALEAVANWAKSFNEKDHDKSLTTLLAALAQVRKEGGK